MTSCQHNQAMLHTSLSFTINHILQKKNDENFIPLSAKARYDLAKGNEAATKSKKHVTEI